MTKELEFSDHSQQLISAMPTAERVEELYAEFNKAFSSSIIIKEVPFIQFGDMSAEELAKAFELHPIIVKPIIASVNVASRAIKRDLGINIDTYGKSLSVEKANILAGYLKPMLPKEIAIPALMELDRYFWTDKEMRAAKGRWEQKVIKFISKSLNLEVKKTKFTSHTNDQYELDGSYQTSDGNISLAVDVKRIEALQDIHKRSDEIVNKAEHFKSVYPNGKFYAFVYFPFPNQYINVKSRLSNPNIDDVFFAAETDSSIETAAQILVGKYQSQKNN